MLELYLESFQWDNLLLCANWYRDYLESSFRPKSEWQFLKGMVQIMALCLAYYATIYQINFILDNNDDNHTNDCTTQYTFTASDINNAITIKTHILTISGIDARRES